MEKDRLTFCIERFDHYYDSVNNKSAVFLGLGTFVIGGLLALYSYLSDNNEFTILMWGSLILAVAFAFVAILVVIFASIPYKSNGDDKSLLYYNSIASKDLMTFSKESEEYNEEDELSDLREQVHKLSMGLKIKFQRLRFAVILFVLIFLSLIPLFVKIILLIKN